MSAQKTVDHNTPRGFATYSFLVDVTTRPRIRFNFERNLSGWKERQVSDQNMNYKYFFGFEFG